LGKPHVRLGELLIKEGKVTLADIERAIELQKKDETFLGTILVKLGAISDEDLAIALSKQLGVAYVSRANGLLIPMLDQELNKLVPEDFARRHSVLPIQLAGDTLRVAMIDPTDIVLLDNLNRITARSIDRVIATKKEIDAAIGQFYGEGGMLKTAIEASFQAKELIGEREDFDSQISLDDLVASAEKAPVIKLTDLIIRQAIKERASDIHLEPFANKIAIRFRIDGVLREISPPDKSMMLPLISRVKILAKMDIAEKRLPQDGSFRATIENRAIDFRVSTIPTVHGEKMVLRILDRSSLSLTLDGLGFSPDESAMFRKAINRPYGMILLTGPTGSGKTTTLYSALNELKSGEKNIVTIEDPVEYQIQGINQVQVKSSIGLTFASGLRAFLRQDPDIMLVGETRDLETAQICVRAALTGHLVFTTLHTNDAPTAINRLIDLGIEPFFVTSSLLLTVAQRLVRRLCPKCKEPVAAAESGLPSPFKDEAKTVFTARGCDACANTGYLGRIPIFEMMSMSEKIETLALRNAGMAEIREAARAAGMVTLEESGYRKVLRGDTSLEEILRMTMSGG